jgi:hypothetical protein
MIDDEVGVGFCDEFFETDDGFLRVQKLTGRMKVMRSLS